MTDKICPRCEKSYEGWPALSRRDNKTEICSPCGQEEAMADFVGFMQRGKIAEAVKPASP